MRLYTLYFLGKERILNVARGLQPICKVVSYKIEMPFYVFNKDIANNDSYPN